MAGTAAGLLSAHARESYTGKHVRFIHCDPVIRERTRHRYAIIQVLVYALKERVRGEHSGMESVAKDERGSSPH